MKMIINLIKEKFNFTNYKRLWEEQNVELDRMQLKIHRQNKEIKKQELKIEKLEKEIIDLKAHTASKKVK